MCNLFSFHLHTYIMLRGADGTNWDLIIAREYIANGFRERAAELANLNLGPRTDLEIEARLQQDVGAEQLTTIDLRLMHDTDTDRIFARPTRIHSRSSV